MTKKTKRQQKMQGMVDRDKLYTLDEAVALLKECPTAKFDETVEISMKLGLNLKKPEENVRDTFSLPHGTGRSVKIAVIASKEEDKKAARDAGADQVGDKDLIEKVKTDGIQADVYVTTPDMMIELRQIARILGPKGLMPSPKAGTIVTGDMAEAIKQIKAGRIEYKATNKGMPDTMAVINNPIGKISFEQSQILENAKAFIGEIQRAKPSSSKGVYIQSVALATTMGYGVKIDTKSVVEA